MRARAKPCSQLEYSVSALVPHLHAPLCIGSSDDVRDGTMTGAPSSGASDVLSVINILADKLITLRDQHCTTELGLDECKDLENKIIKYYARYALSKFQGITLQSTYSWNDVCLQLQFKILLSFSTRVSHFRFSFSPLYP